MAAKLQNSKSAKDELREAIRSLGTTMGLNNAFTKFLELTATALGAELDPVNAKVRDQQYEDAQKGLKPDELSEFARMTALMWLSVLEHQEEPIDIPIREITLPAVCASWMPARQRTGFLSSGPLIWSVTIWNRKVKSASRSF